MIGLAAALLFSQSPVVACLIGLAFALSSTAMALQLLTERRLLPTQAGKSAFSILLFQDIAVIPVISILPLLAVSEAQAAVAKGNIWLEVFKVVGVLALTIVGGRLLLRPILRRIASLHLREIFTAFALFLVVGMSFVMQQLEISMALGAFIAGVLLADSEYRHALESDIEPFKGLLMGLFFISVGMTVDSDMVQAHPWFFASIVVGVFLAKAFIHIGLAVLFKVPRKQIPFFAIVLAQVGEFAFVIFGAAKAFKIIPDEISSSLVAIVALSMLFTPITVLFYDQIFLRFFAQSGRQQDVVEDAHNPVIIAGFGRFGQIVGRLLYANKIKATVLDFEPDQIEVVRRFGFKVYYGDATRLDLLESAGARQAQTLIVAIDNIEDSLKLVDVAQESFPHLKIYARARNLAHMYSLMDRKVEVIERETFESSLRLGSKVLQGLGWPAYQSVITANMFRDHNLKMVQQLHSRRDNPDELISKNKQARDDLEKMFEKENEYRGRGESWGKDV